MCGGGQDYPQYVVEKARRLSRRIQNPAARYALKRVARTGSIRALETLGWLLDGSTPFSSEEGIYRLYGHFGGTQPKSKATRLLNQIIGASGERAEQVLEQIDIMCARNMLNENAEQRLTQILNAVQADRVFPDLAVANLRRSWETQIA